MSIPNVAVITYNRFSPFHLSVPCIVFGYRSQDAPLFDLKVCAAEPGPLVAAPGLEIEPQHGLESLEDADIVIVPCWRDPDETPPEPLLAALSDVYRRGAQVVGLCLGTYVLAAAGLLDGRRASTHWEYADDFSNRFPKVKLDMDVLYIDEDRLITSAGTAAGLDCCLYLVRRRYGGQIANRIARRLVMPPHRQGGQAQYIEQPVPVNIRDERLAELFFWVRQNIALPHSLDSVAERAMMSRRTFTRHFHKATGMPFGAWLLNERLRLAQLMLEDGKHSIDVVSMAVGFGAAASFRHHFRAAFGVSPAAWRRTFATRQV